MTGFKFFITVEKCNDGDYSAECHAEVQRRCDNAIIANSEAECMDEYFVANQIFNFDADGNDDNYNLWNCFVQNYAVIDAQMVTA